MRVRSIPFKLAVVLAVFVFTTGAALAQERFVTQSGGRGLQNAKMTARVSKAEKEIVNIFADLADIEPFARAAIATCSASDNKLRWTGTEWSCDEETDPTVQDFAKTALPDCSNGTSLSARNGSFECVEDEGLIEETDPTVMSFAKSSLPSCGTGQLLSANGSSFECILDDAGVSVEVDPSVADFAKTSLPTCGVGQVLKSNGSGLYCVNDEQGLSVEVDPTTLSFARNDVEGYEFAACEENHVLTTNDDGTQLECIPDQGSAADALALGELSDVDTGDQALHKVLMYDGVNWVAKTEADPNVQTFARTGYTLAACAAGQVLTTSADATQLVCQNDAGGAASPISLAGLGDVTITAVADGEVLRYNNTSGVWENSDDKLGTLTDTRWCRVSGSEIVCDITAPTNCNNDEIIDWDGTGWACTNVSTGLAGSIDLGDLGDVTIASVADDQVLRYNSGSSVWVNSSDKIGTLTNNKWCTTDGSDITCGTDAPVTCSSPNVIRWTGATWECADISAGVSSNISLTDLSDVDVTGASSGQVLMYNGTRWVDADLNQIKQGDSAVVVADSGSGAVQIQIDGGAALHVDSAGDVGIGTTNPQTELEVVGAISATSLGLSGNATVGGNLTVTGNILTSQDLTVAGTTFSQGGISTTEISATVYYGDGSNLSGVTASSADWYGLTNIPTGVLNISVTALDAAELQQLQNIDATTVSGAQWGYLGLLNQGLATTDVVTFANITGALSSTAVDIDGGTIDGTVLGGTTAATASFTTVDASSNVRVGGDLTVTGNILTSQDLTVAGTTFSQGGISTTEISATMLYGDGSNLTGVTAASTDRLVSGTTSVIANNGSSVTVNMNGTDVFTVGSDGNVGIGTTDPAEALHLAPGKMLRLDDSTGTYSARFGLDSYKTKIYSSADMLIENGAGGTFELGTNGAWVQKMMLWDNQFVTSSSSFSFLAGHLTGGFGFMTHGATPEYLAIRPVYTNSDIMGLSLYGRNSGADFEAMRIDSSGNVGIGTTSPAYTLDVSGTTNISGNLTVGGTILTNSDLTVQGVTFSQGGISATGDISATAFYGDGSNLTGVTAASTDRLVSGTTSVIANNGSSVTVNMNGTDVFTVGSDGNVGIGTDDPTTPLSVHDSSDSLKIATFNRVGGNNFWDSGQTLQIRTESGAITLRPASSLSVYTGGIQSIFVQSVTGNTGIGLNTPSEKLEVAGNISATGAIIDGDLTVTGDILTNSDLTVQGVTFSQGGISATGDISATAFYGDGSNLTNVTAAQADRLVSGSTRVLAAENSSVTFSMNGTDVMTVGKNGYIGIGMTDPNRALDVASNLVVQAEFSGLNASGAAIDINSIAGATYSGVRVNENNSTRGFFGYYPSTGNIVISKVGAGTELFSIDASGNVGIGEVNPQAKLEVAGVISATGLDVVGPVNITGATSMTTLDANDTTVHGDLTVTGDILTNSDLTVQGVTFSQGGISATGDISATAFYGDGSNLSNLSLGAVSAPGSDEQMLFNDGGAISATGVYFDDETARVGVGVSQPSATLDVSGTIKVSGTGVEACDGTALGTFRYVSGQLQFCRP